MRCSSSSDLWGQRCPGHSSADWLLVFPSEQREVLFPPARSQLRPFSPETEGQLMFDALARLC